MEKGDLIRVDYDAWIVESNELYETTKEDVAKEHDVFEEGRNYGPVTTVAGIGRLIKGLDEHIMKADVGQDYKVDIPPEEGYGARDPKLVELHSMAEIRRLPEFRKKDGPSEPYVGMEIFLKGRSAHIIGVTAGRVRVDFNHQLAGRTLRYEYKVVERVEEMAAKVKAMFEADYRKGEEFDVEIKGDDEVVVQLPEVCKYDQEWFVAKYRFVADLREHLGFKTVKLVEEYVKKEEKAEDAAEAPEGEEKKEEAPGETKEDASEEKKDEEPKDEENKEEAPEEEKEE